MGLSCLHGVELSSMCSLQAPRALEDFCLGFRNPTGFWCLGFIGNPRKLEHGFRRIGAGFPFSFV